MSDKRMTSPCSRMPFDKHPRSLLQMQDRWWSIPRKDCHLQAWAEPDAAQQVPAAAAALAAAPAPDLAARAAPAQQPGQQKPVTVEEAGEHHGHFVDEWH